MKRLFALLALIPSLAFAGATIGGSAGGGGSGTVTSVSQTVPSFLSVSGSPVTVSGTLAITWNGGTGVDTWLKTPSSANLAAAMTDETGSGSLVFANSPTLVTPALGTPSALVLTNATGLPIAGITGLGTNVPAALALTLNGSGALTATTSPTFITPVLGAATATSINALTLTSNTTGFSIAGGTTSKTLTMNNTIAFSGTDSTTFTFPAASDTVDTLAAAQTITGVKTFTPAARSSGAASFFTINPPTDTGITASTEEIGFQTNTSTLTWATTGTVGLERLYFFRGLTLASASASQTFTDAATVYINPPIQGTNAVITRNHSLAIVDTTAPSSSITGAVVISNTLGTTATSTGIGNGIINTGGAITAGGLITGSTITSSGAFIASTTSSLATATIAGTATTTALTITPVASTTAISLPYVKITTPADTALATTVEAPGIQLLTGSKQWTAGTVTLQREISWAAPTYTQTAAGTFTTAATMAISGAPVSGTNAAITNDIAVLISAGAVNGAGTAPVNAYSLQILNPTGGSAHNYAIQVGTAGTPITNIRLFQATLAAGTIVVSDAACTTNTKYYPVYHNGFTGAIAPQVLYPSARTAATSFTISSGSAADTSVIDIVAYEP